MPEPCSGSPNFLHGPHPSTAQVYIIVYILYRGADKPLAQPGRKQATATKDFDVRVSFLLS